MDILNFLLQEDKILHIIISLILFISIMILRKYFLKNEGDFRIVAFSIRDVLIIGILKELIDSFGFGNPQIGDMIANSLGIIIPIYLYYLIKESEKIEDSSFIKYEKELINTFRKKLIAKCQKIHKAFKTKKISKKKKEKYKLFNLIIDIYNLSKYTLLITLVWLVNLIILLVDIPFLALCDSLKIFYNSIKISFQKIKN